MEKGSFRRFEGEWDITRLGSDACKIELAMRYEIGNARGRMAGGSPTGSDAIIDASARRAAENLAPAEGSTPGIIGGVQPERRPPNKWLSFSRRRTLIFRTARRASDQWVKALYRLRIHGRRVYANAD